MKKARRNPDTRRSPTGWQTLQPAGLLLGVLLALGFALADTPSRHSRDLRLAGSTAGTHGAPLKKTQPQQAYSVQMHVHASMSEARGSMSSTTLAARMENLDVLWWSDHDYGFTHYHTASNFGFEDWSVPQSDGEAWTDTSNEDLGKEKGVQLSTDNGVDAYTAEISQQRFRSGAASLRLQATNASGTFANLLYKFTSTTVMHKTHTAAGGTTVDISVFPEQLEADARAVIEITLSFQRETPERIVVRYYLDNDPAAEPSVNGAVYRVPLTFKPGAWNDYTLQVVDDIVAGFPDVIAEDNNLNEIKMGVETRNGAEAVAYFDDFAINHNLDTAGRMARHRELLDEIATRWPEVTQLQGVEIGSSDHMNDLSLEAVVLDIDAEALQGGFADDDGWISNLGAFRQYLLDLYVDGIHERGGLVSLNHAFGASWLGTGGTSREAKLSQLIANNVQDADLMEVGYRNRGGHELADHLWLWDQLALNQRYMVGTGVSDFHSWRPGTNANNQNSFVSWVYADNTTKPALIDGLRRGRVFFGDLGLFDGTVDLASGPFVMGQVVLTDRETAQVDVTIDGLQPSDEVRTVWNGAVLGTYTVADTLFAITESVAVGDGGHLRAEVYRADGFEKVFSNPLYLARNLPSGGIGAHRLGVDLGGIVSTQAQGVTLTEGRVRDDGRFLVLRLSLEASAGSLTLDTGATGKVRSVTFAGLAGNHKVAASSVVLSGLEGQGEAIVVVERTTRLP
ncbi:MAG: hypothetical protein AAFN78_01400 [Pseudomonadota bacterium]